MEVQLQDVSYVAEERLPSLTKRFLRWCCRFSLPAQRCLIQPTKLTLPSGTLTTVLGPTGASKSVLLKLLAGVIRPTTGHILQTATLSSETHWLTEPTMAFVAERDPLHERLTVEETFWFSCRLANQESDKDIQALVDDMIEALYLQAARKRWVCNLSAGQRQLVSIATALFTHPRLLVADGLTSGLQSFEKRALLDVVKRLCQQDQMTAVLAVNDPHQSLMQFTDLVVMMAAGYVVFCGKQEECVPWFEQRTGWKASTTAGNTDSIMDVVIKKLAKATFQFQDLTAPTAVLISTGALAAKASHFALTRAGAYERLSATADDDDDVVESASRTSQTEIEFQKLPADKERKEKTRSMLNGNGHGHSGAVLVDVSLGGGSATDTRNALEESAMTANVDQVRRSAGMAPLGVADVKQKESKESTQHGNPVMWNVRSLASQWASEQPPEPTKIATYELDVKDKKATDKPRKKNKKAGRCVAVTYLVQRLARTWWRATSDWGPLFICFAAVLGIVAAVWPDVHKDELSSSAQVVNLIMFFLLVCTVMIPHAMTEYWQQHRQSYDKEQRQSGLYSPCTYVLAQWIWSTVLMFMASFLLSVFLFKVFVPHGELPQFVIFVILVTNHAISHSAVVETIVFLTRSQTHVHYYALAVATCSLMLSGFIVPVAEMPKSVSWLSGISYTRHAFEGLVSIVFPDRDIVNQLFGVPQTELALILVQSCAVAGFYRFLFSLRAIVGGLQSQCAK
jgi:ABC-type multidrug transport system ATPase subunit